MQNAEQYFVLFAFLLVGVVVGYVTFLIFRISVQQQKFDWSGSLAVITSLAGGGFLSYWSQSRHFAAYGIGFFIGFAAYWRFLQSPSARRGSEVAPLAGPTTAPDLDDELDAKSDALPTRGSRARLPEDPADLIKTISDVAVPTAERLRALLALRTGLHSEEISLADSLRLDLDLTDFDLLVMPALLPVSFAPQPDSLRVCPKN
jgi:hypothetical protein